MAASYNERCSGLLVIVLCLYLCLSAVQAGRLDLLRYGVLRGCDGCAGGTVRQTAWLGSSVMVLRQRGCCVLGRVSCVRESVVGWGALVIAASLYWWSLQPYSLLKDYRRTIIHLDSPHNRHVDQSLPVLLLLLYIAVAWLGQVRHIGVEDCSGPLRL